MGPVDQPLAGVRPELSWLIGLRAQSRRLELLPRGRVSATRSGGHRSPFRGRGLDYLESRPYLPGDEPRQMDWRLSARRALPHVKVFAEERERPVWLWVDQGPSMRFGTRVAFKSAVAAQVAALLGWAAVESGDRVGGLVFDEQRLLTQPPQAQLRGLLPLLARLSDPLGPPEGGRSPLIEAIQRLAGLVRHASLIVMISDFITLDESFGPWLGRLSGKNELILILIHDPIESEPPPPGRYPVFWEGRHGLLDLMAPQARQGLVACLDRRQALLETLARRYNAHWLRLATNAPVGLNLAAALRGGDPSPRRGL